MNKTRLALIGGGRIGKIHLKAMSEVSEAELVAIVAVSYTHLTLPTNREV